MSDGIFSYNININYSDVDENNELSNRGILRLLQEVAGIHSGFLGYGVNDIPNTSLAWIILNWKLKVYLRPKSNSLLIINTWINKENPLFFYRNFEVLDNKNNLVASACSKWVLYDLNKQGITKIPKEMKSKYCFLDKSAIQEKWTERLKEPDDSKYVMDYTVQRRDIDTNHHVNNLYYLDYAIEALPEDVYISKKFSNIEIMYKHEAKLPDTLTLFYSRTNLDEYYITIKDKSFKKIHAIIKLA